MRKISIKFFKALTPDSWRKGLIRRFYLWKDNREKNTLRRKILKLYGEKKEVTSEEFEVVNFLQENPLHIFPYNYVHCYKKEDIIVHYDRKKNLRYVLHNGEKLYFKRRMSRRAIQSLYLGLQLDQDYESPHRYLSKTFKVDKSDIVIDSGPAEGNFSLSVIKDVEKVILLECDEEWLEPLNATFEPWKDKVVILNKKVSEQDTNDSISLDKLYQSCKFTFIKADIEGDEGLLLNGLTETFKKKIPLKMVICTYHKKNDYTHISKILKKSQFDIHTTRGFMIYYYDRDLDAPFLRKAVIRAER